MGEQKEMGLKIIIKVDGFQDAKQWMYRLVRAGVATCSSCDKPATHIWWNDAAEWYFECGEHYTDAPMWGGSTRWNPTSFSKRVIPDLVHGWVTSLSAEERKNIWLQEYDATDYYKLLTDDSYKTKQATVLRGSRDFGTSVVVLPLKDGRFAYEIENRAGDSFCHTDGLYAPFASADEAVADARKRVTKA